MPAKAVPEPPTMRERYRAQVRGEIVGRHVRNTIAWCYECR